LRLKGFSKAVKVLFHLDVALEPPLHSHQWNCPGYERARTVVPIPLVCFRIEVFDSACGCTALYSSRPEYSPLRIKKGTASVRSAAIKWMGMVWAAVLLACMPAGADQAAADGQTKPRKGPAAALQPLAGDGRLQISGQDRCPLCGMFPAKRPRSAAAMVLSDGRTFYFCSNGCLLRAWRTPSVYLGVSRASIRRMVALDYFSGAPLDAASAWWVAGSDVIGPMGPALVTLQAPSDVEQFKARHGAKTVFQFDQVDDALWSTLFPSK